MYKPAYVIMIYHTLRIIVNLALNSSMNRRQTYPGYVPVETSIVRCKYNNSKLYTTAAVVQARKKSKLRYYYIAKVLSQVKASTTRYVAQLGYFFAEITTAPPPPTCCVLR